jgi:hypothetical protein
MTDAVQVASITGNPTPEEVVAITVAVTVAGEEMAASASAAAASAAPAQPEGWLSVWVEASRRAAQRGTLARGPWRISGRIARRSRV